MRVLLASVRRVRRRDAWKTRGRCVGGDQRPMGVLAN